jgi:hypothetical protein
VRLASVVAPQLVAARDTVDRAVYGTVSVIAVIAGASHDHESASRVLVFAAVSSLVFWAVHVYASVLADLGPARLHWSAALRKGLRHEHGVVGGVVIPLAVLFLGAVGLLEDQRAIWWSMWAGVVVLFVMPLVWLHPHGRGWWRCLVASGVGGLLGLVLIWFKVVLH